MFKVTTRSVVRSGSTVCFVQLTIFLKMADANRERELGT